MQIRERLRLIPMHKLFIYKVDALRKLTHFPIYFGTPGGPGFEVALQSSSGRAGEVRICVFNEVQRD